ncbi:hypothetical protein ISN44_As11g008970 [Arabidopsis suecica]|uniref:NLP1-9 GAF domain-containing protein n=1 Tax=Arabidopsis suecica TaxID=45249 RepID=A0A8T1Z6V1_ARASU|nr:hypothetical protein ISN44_As11g008970 [Arabidopsis suecica]
MFFCSDNAGGESKIVTVRSKRGWLERLFTKRNQLDNNTFLYRETWRFLYLNHPGKLCVGVVELIMTSPKISYAPEVEKVCKARDHSDAYAEHHLQKGQGVAGRAFLSGNLCFCIDVTRFFKTDYPRKFKLTSCFVVGLKSTYTQDDDYALEFFLPPAITDKSEQDCLLRSLFQTMKQLYSSLNVVFWD